MRMVIVEIWERKERANGMTTEKRLHRYTEWFIGTPELSGMTYAEKIDHAITSVKAKYPIWFVKPNRYAKHHKGNQ